MLLCFFFWERSRYLKKRARAVRDCFGGLYYRRVSHRYRSSTHIGSS